MTKSAVLFPGQGAQAPGMGKTLCEHKVASEMFDLAGDVLGYDLKSMCFDGPAEKLNETRHSQPALYVVGAAAAAVLAETEPERLKGATCAAGLSLGEYTAVHFAGGLTFEDGLKLVARRGEAMQEAADQVDSGMASVLSLDLQIIEELCKSCRDQGEILKPANLLCPGNIAVSGHKSALEKLIPAAQEAGASRVVELAVAGAFHTPLMQSAVAKLQDALSEIEICDTRIPVFSNVDAAPHTSAEEIRGLLARQVVGPVLWEKSLNAMIDSGVEKFEELGTGRVLRGTLKRVNRRFPADGFGD
ncbi:MAG: ACP S-malonyltransferase [Planctomycetota bacterium]